MIKNKRNFAFVVAVASFSLISFSVEAVEIDNGLSTDEQGYWSVPIYLEEAA